MNVNIKKGYVVYSKEDTNLIFIVPHAGHAVENPVHRDDHSDTVASLCWKEMGGRLIMSSVSRNRLFGIDFNRTVPSIKEALNKYKEFLEKSEKISLLDYTKKYAWVAKDETDYYERLKIYQSFWNEAVDGKYIILLHKNFPKIKAVPSIMDFITFSNAGIKKSLIKNIVNQVNSKYFDFFEKIKTDYRNAILADTRRYILNIVRIYEHFDPNKMSQAHRNAIEKDLEKITKYSDKIALMRLKNNFTPYNFLMCTENALKYIPIPQITIEAVHDGKLALGPYNKLFPKRDKTVIEVESNGFLNFWHPHMAAKIIKDVVENIMK